MKSSDTIFALSSGALPSGVAVLRLSGAQSRFALQTLVGGVAEPRVLDYRAIRAPDGSLLDRGMAAFFPSPASSTGEDMAELHLHGSRAAVAAVSAALASLPGLRIAEPGEFTRRAFVNGKLDLAQAEALGDLINAETEAQRRFALETAAGAQSRLYGEWHARLLHARAMIEAELDFSDEADVPGSVSDQVWANLELMTGELRSHLEGYHTAEIIRDGFTVVVLGPPNAGKSSLINALARREVAIVSEEPGTTRDLIEVALDLGGVKVRVVDTAGIRDDATSTVERVGIERAVERAARGDLVLMLSDDAIRPEIALPPGVPAIQVATKSDLGRRPRVGADIEVSTLTGQGVDELLAMLKDKACSAAAASQLLPARDRHVAYLRRCLNATLEALSAADAGLEVRAELLRVASVNLGRITGAVDVEDLLGAIFSNFCVGK